MASEKVDKVIKVLQAKPQILWAMNAVLAVAFKEAEVTLDETEKEELFARLGTAIRPRDVTGPTVPE